MLCVHILGVYAGGHRIPWLSASSPGDVREEMLGERAPRKLAAVQLAVLGPDGARALVGSAHHQPLAGGAATHRACCCDCSAASAKPACNFGVIFGER